MSSITPRPAVLETHAGNGYSADQVRSRAMTVQQLIERLQDAVTDGYLTPDSPVVLHDPKNRYGAAWDAITTMTVVDDEGEPEEDEDDPIWRM